MLTRRSMLGLGARRLSHGAGVQPASADPILHLLNRITYGPRPDEVAHARAIGYAAVVEEQLKPNAIDDRDCDARMKAHAILDLDRRAVHQLRNDSGRAYRALAQGMLTRAVHSRRQLLERVVEFWCDHFNIAGEDFYFDMVLYLREAIRRHALGNFRDLLFATARAPAMLYYLDNYVNVAEHPNENYARELLELHTLGVDGGYTEADVKAVARAFTGWTVHDGIEDGFYFDAGQHDKDAKVVLGHTLPAGRGIEDGLHVLSIAAAHPSTARYLCRKLCIRFVSDDPPATLVSALAAVWQQTDGDIPSVLRALLFSGEFQAAAGQKLRRPLDFLAGALRATGAEVTSYWALEEMMHDLGQPPYGWLPPNGYPDVAGAWLSTGGLLARWNVAMRLTHGAYSDAGGSGWGLAAQLHERIGQPATVGELVDAVAAQVYGAPMPGPARAAFVAYAAGAANETHPVTPFFLADKLASLFGLMLASPGYQWR